MSEAIEIAIVDDHPFFRDGVRRALRREKNIKVTAEGASAADACRIAQEHKPHIMLLDITMPGGGIDAVRSIIANNPSIRIIMLTGSDNDEKVTAALDAGATGYLLKGANTAELLEAVRLVRCGSPYITPSVSSRLVLQASRQRHRSDHFASRCASLSRREQEILEQAVKGLTNAEIAGGLGIALPTVKNYMSRIFEKLEVRNRAEAIAASLGKKQI